MFEQNQPEVGLNCKPDPEEMLQRARKRKEDAQKADSLVMEFLGLRMNLHGRDIEDSVLRILGSIRIKLNEAQQEEQRWLAEIDN